jgi:hypothetical protein
MNACGNLEAALKLMAWPHGVEAVGRPAQEEATACRSLETRMRAGYKALRSGQDFSVSIGKGPGAAQMMKGLGEVVQGSPPILKWIRTGGWCRVAVLQLSTQILSTVDRPVVPDRVSQGPEMGGTSQVQSKTLSIPCRRVCSPAGDAAPPSRSGWLAPRSDTQSRKGDARRCLGLFCVAMSCPRHTAQTPGVAKLPLGNGEVRMAPERVGRPWRWPALVNGMLTAFSPRGVLCLTFR